MSVSFENIARDIAQLPRHERLALAKLLLELDNASTEVWSDQRWDAEIRARVLAADQGRIEPMEYEQVRKELASRFK